MALSVSSAISAEYYDGLVLSAVVKMMDLQKFYNPSKNCENLNNLLDKNYSWVNS